LITISQHCSRWEVGWRDDGDDDDEVVVVVVVVVVNVR
jgi:hypothetical protein